MRNLRLVFAALALLALAASSSAIAQSYTFTNLGTLGGQSSFAYGINARGDVVGWSLPPSSGLPHAFLYRDGRMTDLSSLIPPGSDLYRLQFAYDINDLGHIVGQANTFSGRSPAFLYKDGQAINLGTLGGYRSEARGINNSGQVVGWADTGEGETHAFFFNGGQMTDLGTLGGSNSVALSINDNGDIVGSSETATAESHAFLYRGGQMKDLGTLGGTRSDAYAINASGQVTGSAEVAGTFPPERSFLYSGGQLSPLDIQGPSIARGINSKGEIVGTLASSSAFLYRNGLAINLNSFVAPNPGLWLHWGTDINDRGQIVGYGYTSTSNGQTVVNAYLLTPAPLMVQIDIKPGSYPNTINLGSRGVITVAVLSSVTFDATRVDGNTVTLAGASVAVRGKGNRLMTSKEDVNGDGLLDLVAQVETENLDPGTFQDGYAVLSAMTNDGIKIQGRDELLIVH